VLVPHRVFLALLEQRPHLVSGLLVGLSERLADFADRIGELGVGRVEPRLARLFLKLTATVGRRERDGVFVPVPLSRQELADLVCATIETCIRIMSRWGKRNIITTSKDGFLVINREILQVLAQADLNGSCDPVTRPAR
jgi:CRP-like cAMP-binding protein